jgi:hypothetical protein
MYIYIYIVEGLMEKEKQELEKPEGQERPHVTQVLVN